MSRDGSVGGSKPKESSVDNNTTTIEEDEKEEEEEEEERFYESLDRIATSSCSCSCSSSASNSDSDPELNQDQITNLPLLSSRFPDGYDIWISEPASVTERRQSLFLRMGLLGCSKLLSHRRSFSCDHLSCRNKKGESMELLGPQFGSTVVSSSSSGIIWSKLDGEERVDMEGSVNFSSCSHSSSLTNFRVLNSVNSCDGPFIKGNDRDHGIVEIDPQTEVISSCKPPSGKLGKRISDSVKSNEDFHSSVLSNSSSGEFLIGSDEEVANQVCRIKDLDNGKEFVVNEVNKLREVGTGRQLTMEEFEICVGHSPIVQELMRRQNVEVGNRDQLHRNLTGTETLRSKRKVGSWFSTFKSSAKGHKERSSDERDTGSERQGRRSSSATDDSQDISFHGPERVRVKQYGKTFKELSALYKSQEIQAHNGSIWSIKFSLDGRYLASAGEDGIINVWQVVESERKGELLFERQDDGNFNLFLIPNGSPEPSTLSPNADSFHDKKKRGRSSLSRKSMSLDHIFVPETVFALSDRPICSFHGHHDDVLDLSWSKSQHLLSSSMDKTVRLWHLSSKSCLKIFSHSDYVTCIHFNPVDDRYFISGSLDSKVRIWSIPDRQVVDWTDLREMVTAACYTPDGQGAFVGTYKGSCRLYNTSENKLHVKRQINLQNKKKKGHLKKITGFQFAPRSSSEVFISSADSRVRVVDGVDLAHKFKGFRNTNSQISASVSANGKHVVSASEDSYVYVWKHESDSRLSRSKGVTVTRSYEHFHCQDVSVAIPWPGFSDPCHHDKPDPPPEEEPFRAGHSSTLLHHLNGYGGGIAQSSKGTPSPRKGTSPGATNGHLFDRTSATWPEEKLVLNCRNRCPHPKIDVPDGINPQMSAYGMVIVTAGLRGEIRTFQNFGFPVRI